ncbi:Vancomycin B-type resistance protein VanW [Alloactinosynnema sp. L-07]|uniref:VanW family protein n=1 Tax=Alloactinosynnema sp. L-07 TaxID=1653480 RepID=UPI00065EF1D6|nr:VanW family protein [Alloactinosynnema sp. L-07]CRK60559.1 Vancomycin B-type resistance protein VanW [Alloactinosynnema sp. L-07]
MPDDHKWPGEHSWPEPPGERTELLPRAPIQPWGAGFEAPTERFQPAPDQSAEPEKKAPGWRKPAIIAGSVLGALALLYGVDLALSGGEVPRGVTVAGVEVGGLAQADAERTLREELEPRLTKPVTVRAGTIEDQVDPAKSGLTLDWAATLAQAGDQPLNPITRISSLFSTREVGVVSGTDDAKLTAAIDQLKGKVAKSPVEGAIKFDGATPAMIEPVAGQELDTAKARDRLVADWLAGKPLVLAVTETPVKTSLDGVRAAFEQVAKPAVAAPVVVKGEGKDAKIEPAVIASALTFETADGGGLTPKLDTAKIVEAVKPQLASTEKEGKDAQVVFEGGAPTVTPSVDGMGVKYDTAFATLLDVLKKAEAREIKVEYAKTPAKVTTEQANQLGIKEVIGEFTTKGFAADSGVNIRVTAQEVNGAIVKPGETFSLNGHTGPRTAAQGYVEAGVIKDGAPGREVGGGISQFATTLYNATYFAALKDAGHKEHSYYISRYPAAREATVFQDHAGNSVIDLKFTNDSATGIAIQTVWTPSSITVKIWGTKKYTVESVTGGRSAETPPNEKAGPAANCKASNGAPGFTTSDTRIIRDAATGAEVRRNTRTVKYNPQPKIVCQPPPAG